MTGATVKLTETGTGYSRAATTDSAGLFTFPNLKVGTYSLDVNAQGFQKYHASGIVLNVSRTLRQDVQLKVGAAAETVTVQAGTLTVQTESNVVSTLIGSEQITHIVTGKPQFCRSGRLGHGRQFRAARQQHAHVGGRDFHQHQRTAPEPQQLAD